MLWSLAPCGVGAPRAGVGAQRSASARRCGVARSLPPPPRPLHARAPRAAPRPSRAHVASTRTVAAAGGSAANPSALRVEEAMSTDVICFRDTEALQDAMRVMLAKSVSGAPVLNAAGKLVGILSETDLLWKEAGSPQDEWIIPPLMLPFVDQIVAWRDNDKFQAEVKKVLARTVGEAMTADVTVAPEATLQDAAQLMLRKKVNRLPVLSGGALVGVLTRSDVVSALARFGTSIPV